MGADAQHLAHRDLRQPVGCGVAGRDDLCGFDLLQPAQRWYALGHGHQELACGCSEVRISAATGVVMRTSERKPHEFNRFASVLSISKFETRLRKMIRTSKSGH